MYRPLIPVTALPMGWNSLVYSTQRDQKMPMTTGPYLGLSTLTMIYDDFTFDPHTYQRKRGTRITRFYCRRFNNLISMVSDEERLICGSSRDTSGVLAKSSLSIGLQEKMEDYWYKTDHLYLFSDKWQKYIHKSKAYATVLLSRKQLVASISSPKDRLSRVLEYIGTYVYVCLLGRFMP